MPPLGTHLRFTTLLAPLLDIPAESGHFLLGVTAPDAFEPDGEESFSQHHFQDNDGQISLENFRKGTNFNLEPSDDSAWSFLCGYYSHLWTGWYTKTHLRCDVR